MATDRPARQAARFYAGDAGTLADDVRDLLGPIRPRPALGVMVPHAGYVYSGAVAGRVYATTEVPPTVVLLGPKHTWDGALLALNRRGRWRLPGGAVPIAADLADALAAALPLFEDDDRAHAREHSLEVQLPFLQARHPDLAIVPMLLGSALSPAQCVELGERIAAVLRGWPTPVLLVASTDMHHQGADDLPAGSTTWGEVRRRSARALERLDALDPHGLVRVCRDESISMCGVLPTAVTLAACVALGADRAERVAVTDSHAVAGGDGAWVVGYAGYRFVREAAVTPV